MEWASLYSARRSGDKEQKGYGDRQRNAFLRDYDRIIFSSAFRRLQNKTQVFPLPGAVFVHNRLTHSLEVASVGRSLGKLAGDALADKYPGMSVESTEFYRYELSSVIAAACLGHDIGNPPFGHSGEDAIRTFFKELEGEDKRLVYDTLSKEQIADFENFEGNANAFRTLTHSFNETDPGGYKLTYTTLAAIVKYPSSSASGFKKTGLIATKKSGYFDSELDTYNTLAKELHIPANNVHIGVHARHPFVYLTEAADDICYRVIDLEDAHRLGIVSYEKFIALFLPFFKEGSEHEYKSRQYILQKLSRLNDDNQKVQYIRAIWIGHMIERLAQVFIEQEEALLAGTLEKDLLKCMTADEQEFIKHINEYSVAHIYNHKSVVEIEIAGYHVIGGLLKEFVRAITHPDLSKSKKLRQLISKQFPVSDDKNKYDNIQSVVDFISGMTDLYAIDLYRKITGISIPLIR